MTLAIARKEHKSPIQPIHVNKLQNATATNLFDTLMMMIIVVVASSFIGLRILLNKFKNDHLSFNLLESQLFHASYNIFFPFLHVSTLTIYFLAKKKHVFKFIVESFPIKYNK